MQNTVVFTFHFIYWQLWCLQHLEAVKTMITMIDLFLQYETIVFFFQIMYRTAFWNF